MIITIGLVLIFNGLAAWIWTAEIRGVPEPVPERDRGRSAASRSRSEDLGTIAVVLVLVALLWAFFQFTKIGLALRASALNPDASRLVGVRVGWMLAIGWGLAAMLGAVAGMLAAPTVFLDPNDDAGDRSSTPSPRRCSAGSTPRSAPSSAGSCSASASTCSARYVDFVGADLRLPVALLIILVVLLVRPAGLFGKPVARRV